MSQSKNRMDLGAQNRRLVLGEILYEGPISRTQIAQNIGLSGASVSRITRDLIGAGLIEEGERFIGSARVGRKFVGMRIKPRGCFVTAIAINAFRQDIVIADFANNVIAGKQLRFDDLSNAEQVLSRCAKTLQSLVDKNAIERNRLVGCGVTITGAIDPSRNFLRSAPPLDWRELDVGEILERYIDYPLYLDNIPNAKNITAHCFGSARKRENVLLFNASLAIGCSIMIDGRIYRGTDFQAGMLKSMEIPDPESGQLKPLDQLAGGYALVDAENAAAQAKQLERIIASPEDDVATINALESAGTALAYLVKNAYNLLHPQAVVVSGPLMDSAPYRRGLFDRLNASMDSAIVESSVISSPMSSLEAAQSLAIYQALMQTDLSTLAAFQPKAS